jgi:trans-aconitate methyltransferase
LITAYFGLISMMASQAEPAPAARDPTFRSYTAEQAKYYAEHRSAYNQKLYDIVLNHHTNTGGKLDLYVDLGCGPGKSTRDIAVMFDEAIGVDAGQSMIEQARAAGGKTKSGKDVRYEIMPAEELSKLEGLKPGSVDLLTAATAVSITPETRRHHG